MHMLVQTGPSYQGKFLEDIPNGYGELRSSADAVADVETLRERMRTDGYLYLPGLLDTARVAAARDAMIEKLDGLGVIDPDSPRSEAVVRPNVEMPNLVDKANGVPEVFQLLYEGNMMAFWERFLGAEVLHFDYTWFRAGMTGRNTHPHCDRVYMGRGTTNLYTAWTPLIDVPFDLGGLMILEESHTRGDLLGDYWEMDVDAYCTNPPPASGEESGRAKLQRTPRGDFDDDAVRLQEVFQQRWLCTEYAAGDVLLFGMHTLHAAADNRTHRFRLSTDSRYQLASEPVDERWYGPNRTGHGANARRGLIC